MLTLHTIRSNISDTVIFSRNYSVEFFKDFLTPKVVFFRKVNKQLLENNGNIQELITFHSHLYIYLEFS